ncbi:hypothetical protein ASE61_12715 [Bosea sp. Root670]|uniref:glycosyltransferase n=1 Tax=Bosea sp. Root670 TaxID=1736583 RepID=UPI000712CC0A|nr:glycosyltransferase [Bosea sp. Root670]KRE03331.1 hypothetical protein ASE61_12715 [Bosea sp. Root670]
MKVLVVSNMYPTLENPIGGIFVHEQVKALRLTGIDARVVSGKPLWLSGRRPQAALRRRQDEIAKRRHSFTWRTYDGVPVAEFRYFAGAFARPWLYPWIYRNALSAWLPELANDFPYEVVHTHTAFLDGRAGISAATHRGVPMVLTEHTGPFSLVTKDSLFRAHTLAGMRGADRVIAVSHALRREIARNLPQMREEAILVLPNGVDTGFFEPQSEVDQPAASTLGSTQNPNPTNFQGVLQTANREPVLARFIASLRESLAEIGDRPITGREFARCIETATLIGFDEEARQAAFAAVGLPESSRREEAGEEQSDAAEDTPTITALWVGHLVEVKRVDRLLDALAVAIRRKSNLRLRLVGGGELETVLRAQAETLGIARFITFLPTIDREGVRREMTHADFLVISSETETFGVVGIEAMAMGLPVLATDCGGPADYITGRELGELVGNSTEDIAIGLQRMVDRIGEFDRSAIRRHAVDGFDFSGVAARLQALYAELLAGSGCEKLAAI